MHSVEIPQPPPDTVPLPPSPHPITPPPPGVPGPPPIPPEVVQPPASQGPGALPSQASRSLRTGLAA